MVHCPCYYFNVEKILQAFLVPKERENGKSPLDKQQKRRYHNINIFNIEFKN